MWVIIVALARKQITREEINHRLHEQGMRAGFGCVYVMETTKRDRPVLKIGYTTRNAKTRARALEKKHGRSFKVLYSFNTKRPYILEQFVHEYLKDALHHVSGEYFDCSAEEAKRVIKFIGAPTRGDVRGYKEGVASLGVNHVRLPLRVWEERSVNEASGYSFKSVFVYTIALMLLAIVISASS
jgi:hypothetical protein